MKKERPILFSAPMVRAILAGKKTQTRRLLKGDHIPKPIHEDEPLNKDHGKKFYNIPQSGRWGFIFSGVTEDEIMKDMRSFCPYGKPGDRLWVRERFAKQQVGETLYYYADQSVKYESGKTEKIEFDDIKWKPSIHMPRKASRINLEIKNVRVERLTDISGDDAKAEGIEVRNALGADVTDFAELWESINGKGSWIQNPWVWVVEFEVVK